MVFHSRIHKLSPTSLARKDYLWADQVGSVVCIHGPRTEPLDPRLSFYSLGYSLSPTIGVSVRVPKMWNR